MSIKQQMIERAGTCGEWAVRVDSNIFTVVTSHSGRTTFGVNGQMVTEEAFDKLLAMYAVAAQALIDRDSDVKARELAQMRRPTAFDRLGVRSRS